MKKINDMKKITVSLLILTFLLFLLPGCGKKEAKDTGNVRIGGLKGPTTIGLVKLLEDAENGETANDYAFTMAAAGDELTPLFLQGELDIIAVPANLGSVLYNKTEGNVKMLAVNTLGVVYIVEKGGSTVQSLADLKGRTIYATGKGAIPEYALTYLLKENGLSIGTDVNVEWKSEPTEIVSLMSGEETAVAMLPQPFVTVAEGKIENLRVALDLTAEWEALDNGSDYITAGLFVRKEFYEAHPERVDTFLREYEASVSYVNEKPAEAAQLVEKQGIVKAAVAEKAIPFCNVVSVSGEEMKTMAEGFFGILYDLNPKALGGALPGEDFYITNE